MTPSRASTTTLRHPMRALRLDNLDFGYIHHGYFTQASLTTVQVSALLTLRPRGDVRVYG
ncbi:hypothetical protein [Oryza sativa Japonica Group]|uniref:Uncharacterized protein n=1 Tax=Oryza sativa subsp. japonica TaxID=39947 RepID=Q5JL53_ORYSJ|nr:hypothetical protein [Oryza sativa Japonica Group]